MSEVLADLVRTDFVQRTERELLDAPPIALLGVSAAAAAQLAALGIVTVFDLALSRIFATANQLVAAASGDDAFLRFGRAPADAVNPIAAGEHRVDQLAAEPLTVLAGIDAERAAAIESALQVTTVRELALWPPHRAARTIVTRTLNPGQEHGFDPEAPGDLIPATGRFPTDRVFYNANVLISVDDGGDQVDLVEAGPIDLSGGPNLLTTPATGAVLTFSQSWFPIGTALGQLLYSLPLAPGESTKLAVIDWRRRTSTAIEENLSQTESLSNTVTQNRAVSEVVSGVVSEVQSGSSTVTSEATAGSVGAAGGGLVGAALVGGTASASANSATTAGVFTSAGRRDVAAAMQQHVSDSTHQQAFSSRNRHAATVSEAFAEERESISTRTVSNYNHMHALTVQYYEVVQIYRTELRLETVRRLLFIPFGLLDFRDDQVILRHRTALIRGALDPYVRDLLLQATGVVSASLELPRNPTFAADPDDTKKEQLAAAKAAAREAAINDAKVRSSFRNAKDRGAVVRLGDGTLSAWEMPGGVPLIDVEWGEPTGRVTGFRVWLESGQSLNVSDNGLTRSGTEINPDLGRAVPVDRLLDIDIEFTAADEAERHPVRLVFLVDSRRVVIPCSCVLPAGRERARLVRFAAPVPLAELGDILSEHALHYSRIVWLNTEPNELLMQMANLTYRDKRLVDVIEPTPVAVLGNAVGFVWNDESDPEWLEWRKTRTAAPPTHDLVPLPTDGVFAEAVLGRFNSAEKLDMSRFWNWQDSPIPIQAPDIAAIQAGQRDGVDVAPTGSLDGSVVNIVTPRDLPAPDGVGATLTALTASNLFRDMSGAAQVAALNQAALQAASAGASAAGTQAGANLATFAQFQVEALKAIAPLLGAALGVPVAPAPGGSNISNAGAVANEAEKIDAVLTAEAAARPTGGGGGGGGGGGDSGGGDTGGGGGGGGGGRTPRSSNREDVVRGTAGLAPRTPDGPAIRDAVLQFVFKDFKNRPIDGVFDIELEKDGLSIDGVSLSAGTPILREDAEFVGGKHRLAIVLEEVAGPLSLLLRGSPRLGDSTIVDKDFDGSELLALPEGFTTFIVIVTMDFETIKVTALDVEEAKAVITGGIEATIGDEPDTASPLAGTVRKPRKNRQSKVAPSRLAQLASLIDIEVTGSVTGSGTDTDTTSREFDFDCKVPTLALTIALDLRPGFSR